MSGSERFLTPSIIRPSTLNGNLTSPRRSYGFTPIASVPPPSQFIPQTVRPVPTNSGKEAVLKLNWLEMTCLICCLQEMIYLLLLKLWNLSFSKDHSVTCVTSVSNFICTVKDHLLPWACAGTVLQGAFYLFQCTYFMLQGAILIFTVWTHMVTV